MAAKLVADVFMRKGTEKWRISAAEKPKSGGSGSGCLLPPIVYSNSFSYWGWGRIAEAGKISFDTHSTENRKNPSATPPHYHPPQPPSPSRIYAFTKHHGPTRGIDSTRRGAVHSAGVVLPRFLPGRGDRAEGGNRQSELRCRKGHDYSRTPASQSPPTGNSSPQRRNQVTSPERQSTHLTTTPATRCRAETVRPRQQRRQRTKAQDQSTRRSHHTMPMTTRSLRMPRLRSRSHTRRWATMSMSTRTIETAACQTRESKNPLWATRTLPAHIRKTNRGKITKRETPQHTPTHQQRQPRPLPPTSLPITTKNRGETPRTSSPTRLKKS